MQTRSRTLYYRRASWINQNPPSLQDVLDEAHAHLSTTSERTFSYQEGKTVGLAWKQKRNSHALGHLAYFVPDQPTSLVPIPSGHASDDTDEHPPPPGTNFLEGDIFYLVRDDQVLLCPSETREAALSAYFESLVDRRLGRSLAAAMSLEPVAQYDKVRLLEQEGVKKLRLKASLYEASVDHLERTTVRKTLLGTFTDTLRDLFRGDEELQDIEAKENLMVRLEISFDSRKRGGRLGKRRIEEIADKVVRDGEKEGFSIVTGTGKILTPEEIRLSKQAYIRAHGRSVDRDDAWRKLEEYYRDLARAGALVQ